MGRHRAPRFKSTQCTGGYTQLYSPSVKTAISVPDETYERATRRAAELGMSRSELFARAAARYLDELDAESVTHQIDEALDAAGADTSSLDAADIGRRLLADVTDEW